MESQLERFRRDDTTLAKNWEASEELFLPATVGL